MKSKTIHVVEAITPLDGRYKERVEELSEYVSEKALMQTRVEVEIRYLEALSKEGIIRKLTPSEKKELDTIISNFSLEDAVRIKEIEETTRHDVKAVEYFLKEKIKGKSLSNVSEKIHLFLTSEDVNNISQRLLLMRALSQIIIPCLTSFLLELTHKTDEYKDIAMLARTHGQNAVPTTVGKELAVFADRLDRELDKLQKINLTGKLSGAVGNYNAFQVSFPKKTYKEWKSFSSTFVTQFGLVESPVTTQINTYEDIIETLQCLQRINGIGIDFSSDMWRYISDNWFLQKKVSGEVGSSTMPQKVNPIDFENGEGNISLSNDVIKGLVERLPVSRLQRDLRDSTQIRNLGLVLGYMLLGWKSIQKGFSKVTVNKTVISEHLNCDWSILSEGAQVLLRTHDEVDDPYLLFKDMTRGEKMDEKSWKEALHKLSISQKTKEILLEMTPEGYCGFASEIASQVAKNISSKYKGKIK